MMRLWEFDPLGVVASTSFNINKEPCNFVQVILGYFWMSDEELGFDPTIEEVDGKYMLFRRNDRTERLRMDKLIQQRRVVTR